VAGTSNLWVGYKYPVSWILTGSPPFPICQDRPTRSPNPKPWIRAPNPPFPPRSRDPAIPPEFTQIPRFLEISRFLHISHFDPVSQRLLGSGRSPVSDLRDVSRNPCFTGLGQPVPDRSQPVRRQPGAPPTQAPGLGARRGRDGAPRRDPGILTGRPVPPLSGRGSAPEPRSQGIP